MRPIYLSLILILISSSLFSQKLIPYLKNGKYGFSDLNGNLAIECQFDEVQDFGTKGFAFVKTDQYWGVIDSVGNYIPLLLSGKYPPYYQITKIEDADPNLGINYNNPFQVYIPNEGKWGILNLKTKYFSGLCYYPPGAFQNPETRKLPFRPSDPPSLIYFKNGIYIVQKGMAQFNVINSNGVELFEEDFEAIEDISSNRIAVYKNGLGALANKSGQIITPFSFLNIDKSINDHIIVSNHGLKKSKLFFSENRNYDIEKAGIVDSNGQVIIDTVFRSFFPIDGIGYIVIKQNKYGVLSLSGDTLIHFLYDWLNKNNELNFRVTIGDCSGIIDLDGNILIPLEYDIISNCYLENYYSYKDGELHGIINKNNKIIFQTDLGAVNQFQDDSTKYVYSKNGKVGLLYKNGEIFLPAQFNKISQIDSHYYLIDVNHNKGLMNINTREIVVEPKYDRIQRVENNISDYYIMKTGTTYMYYDQKFRPLFEQPIGDLITSKSPIQVFRDPSTGLRGLTNFFGRILRAPVYDGITIIDIEKDSSMRALIFCEDYIEVADETGQCIFPEGFGITSSPTKWNPYMTEARDLFCVTSGNKLGVINHNGQWVIPPNYHALNTFSKNIISLKDSLGLHLFNGKGERLTDSIYHNVSRFCSFNKLKVGLKIPGSAYKKSNFDGCCDDPTDTIGYYYKYGFIDCNNFELVIDMEYESLTDFSYNTGLAIGRKGIIDSAVVSYIIDTTGRVIQQSQYEIVYWASDKFILIGKETFGLIDLSNNIILRQEWDRIQHAEGKYFFYCQKGDNLYLINIKSGKRFGPFKEKIKTTNWWNGTYFLTINDQIIWVDELGEIIQECDFNEYNIKKMKGITDRFIEINSLEGKYMVNLDNRVFYKGD
jgi:hypothetical protein